MIQPKEEYKVIESYTIARYQGDYTLKLDMNENTLGCSPLVKEALKNISINDISQYPAYGEIEEKIAQTIGVSTNKILITNGGDAGITAIYTTYVSRDEEVLYAVPSYTMYKIDAQRVNAKIITVPYREKWVYPTEDIIKNITDKTKMIVICSPANPTGDIVPEEDICKILDAAPQAIVLLDEAYWRFINRENKSLKHLIDKYDNLIIMHTFSKDYGLAGMRVGYLISNPKNFEFIHKSMDPFSVNNVAIRAALAALEDQEFVTTYAEAIKESKKFTYEKLKEIATEVYPSESNFIFFNVGNKYEWLHSKLLKNRIKIRRYPNNPLLKGYLRLTLGTTEQMKNVLNLMKDYEGIIFDVDGVLVDENVSYRQAIKETFEYFGKKSITLETIQEYKNRGGFINDWVLTKYLLDEINIKLSIEEITDKFQEYYFNNGKGLISKEKLLLDPQIIKDLQSKYKLAVFTGRPREEAEFILRKEGILDCFEILVCSDDLPKEHSKPSPMGIERICEKFGTKNVLYVGDMPDDMVAAERGNIDSVGILPPQDKSDNLKQLLLSKGAIEVYEDLLSALNNIV
ncbi:MAG: histidinol-phosphate transaminase [Vampirovibrionia bacterium]